MGFPLPANDGREAEDREGLMVDASIQDGDERIDVFFGSVSFKRLIALMSKLEIMGED
ncbi:MAG: hypothetical protein HGA28_09150 [Anaerolineaceae bacterium]|nr:hypothetical protein [Anaerolineaceae bacterium]